MVNDVGPKPSHAYFKEKASKTMQQFASELQNAARRALPSDQMIIGPLQPGEERAILTVHLSDPNEITPDLAQWTMWLTSNLPSNISKTQITIEGVFDTGSVALDTKSVLLMVSMPLEVWTMLPDGDVSYRFVSFVKSGNRLLPS